MGDGAVAVLGILGFGWVVDSLLIEPFFMSLVTGTSFTGWTPLTTFLFLYGIPYAVSCAGVGSFIAAIFGK